MLLKILGRYLKPHWKLLVAVGVFQLAQSLASLYLPSLNGKIIDEGVAKGDTGYIVTAGGWMLAVSLLQIAATVGCSRPSAGNAIASARWSSSNAS